MSVYQTESGYSNGHSRDNQGRLIACEHDTRRVRRREYDGTWTILADNYEGKKLNAPNDAAIHADGSVWFTDPGYGILGPYEGHKAEFELPTRVYRVDPQRQAQHRHRGADAPSQRHLLFARLQEGLRGGHRCDRWPDTTPPISSCSTSTATAPASASHKVFADFAPGFTDGIRCDTDGNVWCGWGWGGVDTNGVRVHAPDGTLLAFLHTPEVVANLCFGGTKRNRLFMTGSTSIYAIYVNAVGAALS